MKTERNGAHRIMQRSLRTNAVGDGSFTARDGGGYGGRINTSNHRGCVNSQAIESGMKV